MRLRDTSSIELSYIPTVVLQGTQLRGAQLMETACCSAPVLTQNCLIGFPAPLQT